MSTVNSKDMDNSLNLGPFFGQKNAAPLERGP